MHTPCDNTHEHPLRTHVRGLTRIAELTALFYVSRLTATMRGKLGMDREPAHESETVAARPSAHVRTRRSQGPMRMSRETLAFLLE